MLKFNYHFLLPIDHIEISIDFPRSKILKSFVAQKEPFKLFIFWIAFFDHFDYLDVFLDIEIPLFFLLQKSHRTFRLVQKLLNHRGSCRISDALSRHEIRLLDQIELLAFGWSKMGPNRLGFPLGQVDLFWAQVWADLGGQIAWRSVPSMGGVFGLFGFIFWKSEKVLKFSLEVLKHHYKSNWILSCFLKDFMSLSKCSSK